MRSLAILTNVKNDFCICRVTQMRSKNKWVLSWAMIHPSTKFQDNLFNSFSIILLTNKQTKKNKNRKKKQMRTICISWALTKKHNAFHCVSPDLTIN